MRKEITGLLMLVIVGIMMVGCVSDDSDELSALKERIGENDEFVYISAAVGEDEMLRLFNEYKDVVDEEQAYFFIERNLMNTYDKAGAENLTTDEVKELFISVAESEIANPSIADMYYSEPPSWAPSHDADYADGSLDNSVEIIEAYIRAVGEQDYESIIWYSPDEEAEEWRNFFEAEENSNTGFRVVETAAIGLMKKLNENEILHNTDLSYYEERYDSIQGYLVGIYYETDESSEYIYNGLNIDMILTGLEDGRRRVIEHSIASPWLIDQKFTTEEIDSNPAIAAYIEKRDIVVNNTI